MGDMDEVRARQKLPSRWAGVSGKLPPSLGHLAGPADGTVELPIDLAWSGDRRFNLADPVQRYLYHVTVLTAAVTPEHYTRWLNAELLRSDWARLRLPIALRTIWNDHFPELSAS
jgi:hypothetical protein